MTDQELLRAAIDQSGLSARRFAVEVLIRDERSIRRYLKGESVLPQILRTHLEKLVTKTEDP